MRKEKADAYNVLSALETRKAIVKVNYPKDPNHPNDLNDPL